MVTSKVGLLYELEKGETGLPYSGVPVLLLLLFTTGTGSKLTFLRTEKPAKDSDV